MRKNVGRAFSRKAMFLTVAFLVWASFACAEKFLSDDPIQVDPDCQSIPIPAEIELSQMYDFLENTFLDRKGIPNQKAQNINTLGEVPNSSWFTNRIGLHPMTIEELVRGANQGDGPDMSAPWTIVSAKSQGITPGFTVHDARGDTYFIKFDPLKYPQLTTSAEVISTRFFHAFGYHVAESHLAFITRDHLKVAPDAKIKGEDGKKRRMIEEDVDELLKKVPKLSNGTIQVVAGLRLNGQPLGPFRYYGTRSDDPNDIIPHEDRREIRGLRIFSAWLNHDDSRSINSLDIYVAEGDRGYIKHYLIDFGSTLGSGSVSAQNPRAGNEYILEWPPILKSAFTLGLWDRPWRHVRYPDYPAVGRFEADFFHPERWKPEYPNPAFDKMQTEDAFWATRTVMRFTDEMIRAIVRTGQIIDPEAENDLAGAIIHRRAKIVRHYLSRTNPLDDFRIADGILTFKNLGVEAGLASGCSYQYEWFRFDNAKETTQPLDVPGSSADASIPIPQDTSAYLMVRIRTLNPTQENWKKKVEVFIHNTPPTRIVGIER